MRSLDVEQHWREFSALVGKTQFHRPEGSCSFQVWAESCARLLESLSVRHAKAWLLGNGASQAMSSHYAADLSKNALVPALALSDAAMITCFSNDYSFEESFRQMLRCHMGAGDVLLAISSSGASRNVVAAGEHARGLGCPVIALTGFAADNPLRRLGTHGAYVPTRAYGHVECGHAYLMHALLDVLCERRGGPVGSG